MEWIDANKITPQIDLEVICCVDDDVYMDTYRDEGLGGYYSSGVYPDYWMYKPEPPKEQL